MAPCDELSRISVERPGEGARNYRETGQPRDLRVTCAWGSRDALIVLAETVALIVVTILLGLGAYDGHFYAGVFAGVFATMSALALYRLVARIVNRTTLVLGASGLSSAHGPLPWPGALQVPATHVLTFGVEKRTPAIGGDSFDVWARTRGGEVTLFRGLEDLTAAMRVIAVLEEQLRRLQPVDVGPRERASNAPDVRASAARRFARVSRPDGDVR